MEALQKPVTSEHVEQKRWRALDQVAQLAADRSAAAQQSWEVVGTQVTWLVLEAMKNTESVTGRLHAIHALGALLQYKPNSTVLQRSLDILLRRLLGCFPGGNSGNGGNTGNGAAGEGVGGVGGGDDADRAVAWDLQVMARYCLGELGSCSAFHSVSCLDTLLPIIQQEQARTANLLQGLTTMGVHRPAMLKAALQVMFHVQRSMLNVQCYCRGYL